MNHQADARLAILVEGIEECRLMDAHVNSYDAFTYPMSSKNAVLSAVNLLQSSDADWALGVVDRDFGDVPSSTKGVVISHSYDLIMDLVFARSTQVQRLAVNATDPGKVVALTKAAALTVHEIIVSCCVVVGALRHSATLGLYPGSTRDFPLDGAISAFCRGELDSFVADRGVSRAAGRLDQSAVEALIKQRLLGGSEMSYVCGHDYAAALADLIRYCGGKSFGREHSATLLRSLGSRKHWLRQPVARVVSAWASERGRSIWLSGNGTA